MASVRPFKGRSIQYLFSEQRLKLQDEVDQLSIVTGADLNEIKQQLFNSHYIVPLKLGTPQPSKPFHPHTLAGNRPDKSRVHVTVNIPFEGRKVLFDYEPDNYTYVYLHLGYIVKYAGEQSGIITVEVQLTTYDPNLYKARLQEFMDSISKNIPAINEHIARWNDSLMNEVEALLVNKKGNLDLMESFMREIGLKVNEESTEYLVPPTIKKKAIPSPKDDLRAAVGAIIPYLALDVYDDILHVLTSVGTSIERKPSIYKGKREEDLRDIFLLFLETRYENTSGHGEAFNKHGKTDILLRYAPDNSNIFVAECKVWKGKSSLHRAVNQLLTYLTHRDSKTAIIFFIEQQRYTPVLKTAREEMKKHPNFVCEFDEKATGSYSYEFFLSGDGEARFRLQLVFFHFN